MMIPKDKKILIVGLGLMGGSYARALTKAGYEVKCVTKDQSSIDYALKEGMISFGTTETDPVLIGGSELVIFALYPHIFLEWIRENGHLLSPGTLVTDVTGVKSAVVDEVQAMLTGPTAIVTGKGEVTAVAKDVMDFVGGSDGRASVKGADYDGKIVDAAMVEALSKVPGKDQLRATLLMLLKEPATRLARVLSEKAKKEGGEAPAA